MSRANVQGACIVALCVCMGTLNLCLPPIFSHVIGAVTLVMGGVVGGVMLMRRSYEGRW